MSRLYLQVAPDEQIDDWPDERIWAELRRATRAARLDAARRARSARRAITPMRSFVSAPMRHGRLFLAGDAAHIVPPTGAKGLNLALADAAVLAARWWRCCDGAGELADAYSDRCLRRVWRATHFSWWMTTMLHRAPGGDAFDEALQLSQLRYVTSSRAAGASLAENYVGRTMRAA